MIQSVARRRLPLHLPPREDIDYVINNGAECQKLGRRRVKQIGSDVDIVKSSLSIYLQTCYNTTLHTMHVQVK